MQDHILVPHRRADLEISIMSDGYVVYDPVKDRIHYLNPSSALIFEMCTGDTTLEQIAAGVQTEFDLETPPTAAIKDCLEQLQQEGLLTAS